MNNNTATLFLNRIFVNSFENYLKKNAFMMAVWYVKAHIIITYNLTLL